VQVEAENQQVLDTADGRQVGTGDDVISVSIYVTPAIDVGDVEDCIGAKCRTEEEEYQRGDRQEKQFTSVWAQAFASNTLSSDPVFSDRSKITQICR
jgi:hypothetical protein